jgi:hypothetical protein
MNLDQDKDGKLSKEEAPGPLKEHFAAVDKNSDGQLDEGELKAHAGAMMERFRASAARFREGQPRGEGFRGPGRRSEGRPDRPRGEDKKDSDEDKKPKGEERSDAGSPPEPKGEAVTST